MPVVKIAIVILIVAGVCHAGTVTSSAGGSGTATFNRSATGGTITFGQGASSGGAALYSGYTYQRTLTIDHTKVDTNSLTLTDFPVLISTAGVTFSTGAGGHLANASGFDLIFSTKSDCSLALYHDTETINNTGTSTMTVWVKVPSISSSTDTSFFMCYGNSSITTYQGRSTGTWDSNFKLVWHLPDGTDLTTKDSTSNGKNGTVTGTVPATTGKIDGGSSHSGSALNYITAGTGVHPAATAVTISVWVKADAGTDGYIVNKNYDGSNIPYSLGAPGSLFSGMAFFDGSWHNTTTGTDYRNDGSFHHIAGTYDGSTLKYYYDNLLEKTLSVSSTLSTTNTGETTIGTYLNDAAPFKGSVDEVRISNSVRSEAWIKTEYSNQNSPTTFLSFSAESVSP